jgi:hypothetical protein
MNGLFNPKGFLLAGAIILLSGLALNYFMGMKGELLLVAGEARTLVAGGGINSPQDSTHKTLGMQVTLDSLRIEPYTPEFEILVFGPDTTKSTSGLSTGPVIDRFPLELMKIRQVGETDFYFRHKELYPNFQFSYEYPVNRDTIAPNAPGITLELKTKEGTPIVTLRTDVPNKHTLGDIVSLGAPLFFFWKTSVDSIKAMVNKEGKRENKVVFSGSDQLIFFMHEDTIIEQPLKEGTFYTMPGQDTVGFKVMFNFPDYAYLKAVPSTKGTEILNPVAQVEVWKAGEGYREAFLYPARRGRKMGDFAIPGSDYKLGLGEIREKAVKHCDCYLSLQADSSQAPKALTLESGKAGTLKGYRFTPLECAEGSMEMARIGIARKPGNIQIILGISVLLLTFIYTIFKRNRPVKGA